MNTLFTALWNDQEGFIVSAELILVATIAVLAMIVGLSEIALNINNELEDVASAFGNISQKYQYDGVCGHKSFTQGSHYYDQQDFCDSANNVNPSNNAGEGNR